jgi:hypothetical protein
MYILATQQKSGQNQFGQPYQAEDGTAVYRRSSAGPSDLQEQSVVQDISHLV